MNTIISLIKTIWFTFCGWTIVCLLMVGLPAAMAGGYPEELQTGFTGLCWSYVQWLGQWINPVVELVR